MRNDITKCFQKNAQLVVDKTLFADIVTHIRARSKKIEDFDFFGVCQEIGICAIEIKACLEDLQEYPDNVAAAEDLSESYEQFSLFFCILIKFLYPMMEQLETAIDEKIILKEITD